MATADARMRGSIMFCTMAATAGMYAYAHVALIARNTVDMSTVLARKAAM